MRPARTGDWQGCGGTTISERFSDIADRRGRRTCRPFTGSSRPTSRSATCCRGRSTTSSGTSARFVVAAQATTRVRRLRRAGAAQRRASPKCARSSSTRRSAAGTSGPTLVTSVAADGDARAASRRSARSRTAVALRPPGLHDRAAHLGAGEDRARLHVVLALPPLRPVRGDAAAARRRRRRPGAAGRGHSRHAVAPPPAVALRAPSRSAPRPIPA